MDTNRNRDPDLELSPSFQNLSDSVHDLQKSIEAKIADCDEIIEEVVNKGPVVVFEENEIDGKDSGKSLAVVEERIDFQQNDEEKEKKRKTGKRICEEDLKKEVKRRWIALTCIVVLACITLVAFVIVPQYRTSQDVTTNVAEQEDTYSDNIEGMLEEGTKVSVIQAVRNIMPGEEISTDCFREVKITAEEYNAMRASGKRVCLYEQAGYYVGNYAATYIASGQLFMCDSISLLNMTESEKNPWESGTVVSFSQNSDKMKELTIGDRVTVSIKRVVGAGQSRTSWNIYGRVNGLSFTTKWEGGYAVEYIEATGTITDVEGEDGSSLYSKYQVMSKIPFGDLASEIPTIFTEGAIVPKTVKIAFGSEVGTALSQMNIETADVTYTVNGQEEATDAEQEKVISYIKYANAVLLEKSEN